MLARLLRHGPKLPQATAVRAALNQNLTGANLPAEAAYLDQPNRQSFERPYGWAWLLKLAAELHGWPDTDGAAWSGHLQPLVQAIVARHHHFLPRQTYPIRSGVHSNTAFGLALALDYARVTGDQAFESLLIARSRAYFEQDRDYPAAWEPGGSDFFSPSLIEASLMSRVLPPAGFKVWFDRLLPGLGRGKPASLLTPAAISDRADPQIVHLDGLNLSRAWCMRRIAATLSERDPARAQLLAAANRHAQAGLAHVNSGDYAGAHWLASFAVYMLTPAEA
jgi:hypothetical protein